MLGRNIKAFLDSNTIISGLLFEGNEATLLELGRIKAIQLITNQYVIDEVKQVLTRPEFNLTTEENRGLTRYLNTCLTITEDPPKEAIEGNINMLNDKKDIPVALGAIQSKTDYLVTGDKELQNHPNLPTITTKNLLDKILPKKQSQKK
ncbi:putative toxin-antitoxin system toxin component, PIN family [archaeon]|nr:putative toxin-antitoxin system toxin component, PIN family [archaeon]